MDAARRGVGGAAQGPITPSPGSSPGVSIFSESTPVRTLRRMLSARDVKIGEMVRQWFWLNHHERCQFGVLDDERRLIRERIKAVSRNKKGKK